MNLLSAAFTPEDGKVSESKKQKKKTAFTEEMFDTFREEHKSKEHLLADKKQKIRVKTIANDQTMEQSLNITPPLID